LNDLNADPKTKAQWRKWAQALRTQLQLEPISVGICQQLLHHDLYRQAKHILSYLAFNLEIDLSILHQDTSKTFYVTRTWGKREGLSIHKLDPEKLELHPFGYLQPSAQAERIDPHSLDLVLVPGLCFDKSGTRLGYGMGFYDRLLAEFPTNTPFIGITTTALIVEKLPRESFDVGMTHLATEEGLWST
jgi:5-formyltetrahydrofolate cyclo-ligase